MLETELPQHVAERLLGDAPVPLLPRDEPTVQVRGDEEGVVVEHLLEVRDEPPRVDGVPVEAAAEQVVHPARGHPVEGAGDHLGLSATQKQLERRGRRELRGATEAAPDRVELGAQAPHRV